MRCLTVGSSLQSLMTLFNYASVSLFSELPEQGINILSPCIGCCAGEMAQFRVQGNCKQIFLAVLGRKMVLMSSD